MIDARTEDIIAQITYHRRKELFYEGVIAGVESAEGNPHFEDGPAPAQALVFRKPAR